jgi:GT2 family glycosyltransferase
LQSVSSKIEIILVDNASTDETTDMLSRIDGIHVIVSDVNEGFLTATNRAADVARGRAFLLLNNDAFVRPGAIEAAFATLKEEPNAGAVGGRLILPNGALQEAGSVIWSDGSTQGYGRGIDPESGEAMFRRDVDYCSGAFLMTPAAVWSRLNGFDPVYAPAYYEEVDYCMRVAEIGLRTIYEPEAAR